MMMGLGTSPPRPDARAKVEGTFSFAADLETSSALSAVTLRSPHPHARIRRIETRTARSMPGVAAVLTHDDVPGAARFGLETPDAPVLATDVVRFAGEPVVIIAARSTEEAQRARDAIEVEYEPLLPVLDPLASIAGSPIHPEGNVLRHLTIRHGDPDTTGPIVVDGSYEIGVQDQAPLAPEAGVAIPTSDGGVEIHVATQWLHGDRRQVAASLGLPEDLVRVHLAGVGGAFGAREDVTLQIHLGMLALATGEPVRMTYSRAESFFAHVHRHPARLRYRHHADSDGRLVKVEVSLLMDGGAYASTSRAVLSNAACFAIGPYSVPNAVVDAWAVRTNNPPCGAMRGFGAVQVCFGHEAQMDRLAHTLKIDPVELRVRNALRTGDRLITGQRLECPAPVAEIIRACARAPMPAPPDVSAQCDHRALPGGTGRTTMPSDVRRGTALAVGFKNLMYSEGFDDSAWASVELADGTARVRTACAEVGQGFVTIVEQIIHEEVGPFDVVLEPATTRRGGSAGSTSASRQTWMSGGAVALAARRAAAKLKEVTGETDLVTASRQATAEASAEHHHRATEPLDDNGQGDAHVSFAFACHRAVVDVDPELGLVRLVDLATAQDVGRVLHPVQLRGQLEGGAAQGVGLALMEEVVIEDGVIRNPSFTDYLLPTALDLPELRIAALVENPDPESPLGAKGVGEAPTISSGAAVAGAVRAATGLDLPHIPIRPWDIALA